VFDVYLLAKDLVALGALAGVAYFFWLRATVKPDRLTRSWEAYLILGFIAGLMVSEYTFGAAHLVLQQRGFTPWEPVTSVVAMLLSSLPEGVVWALGAAMFWVHLTIILTFLNFLPLGKHFHVITALPNVFFQKLDGSKVLPTPNLEAEQYRVFCLVALGRMDDAAQAVESVLTLQPEYRPNSADASPRGDERTAKRVTAQMAGSASPRKPSVAMASRSASVSSFDVAWRRSARSTSSAVIPIPSSVTRMSWRPASFSSTVTARAPASIAFSTSSLTTEAGRSTTSPAAI